MLVFGAASHTLATALYLGVDRFGPWLYVVRALHGVSAGFLFSTLFTIAADLVPEERRTQGMALFGISGILPMSVSAFLGEHLLRAGGFVLLFEVALAFSGIALALAPTIPESRPAKKEDGEGSFLAALSEPSLRVLWFVGTLFATALASYFVFMKSFAIDAHLGSVTAFFTAYSVTAIVVRSFLGGLPARFGLERTFPVAVASLGLGLVVLASARGPSALALSGVLSGAGHAYAFPIMLTFFVDRSSPSVRGMVVSLYTALFDLGGFLAGPILGALADAEGHRVAFRVASLLALAGASLFVLFDRKMITRVA
jgi:predicted MFS family arabinose efflux permease